MEIVHRWSYNVLHWLYIVTEREPKINNYAQALSITSTRQRLECFFPCLILIWTATGYMVYTELTRVNVSLNILA